MVEFCYECWNKMNHSEMPRERYVYSWGKELCEECGEYKKVVVDYRRNRFVELLFGIYYRIRGTGK